MEYINTHSKLTKSKKNVNGEVFTPVSLINDMLDKLPNEVWSNPDLKWLDPCAGIANFPYIIFERLNTGLKNIILDEEKRKAHILKKMIYMVELDLTNCEHIREVFKGYDINLYEGSFFDYECLVFDIITLNPPYQQKKEGNKQSKKIWHLIIYKCHKCLAEGGYLLPIHPCGWRDITGVVRGVFEYNNARNLVYLNMNSYTEGKKYFNCYTNFDYYLLQNTLTNTNTTLINDYDNLEYDINLNEWDFIPNGYFNQIRKLLGCEKTDVVHDCNYHYQVIYDRCMYGYDSVRILQDTNTFDIRRPYLSREMDEVYKLPVVYTITKRGGIKCFYSNVDKGHFGIPKVIWTNGRGTYPIIDMEGKYGLTNFAYGIADEPYNLENISIALNNPNFRKIMSYCIFGKLDLFNYKIIAILKRDFYKSFLYLEDIDRL